MPTPMRRAHQLVSDEAELARWLTEAPVGRLATIDGAGYPVIIPLNFVYADGRVFFHSATEGAKLDDLRRHPQVGFEIDRLFTIVPPAERGCQTHAFYQSIVIRGRARVLDRVAEREARVHALQLLVQKYAPAVADRPMDTTDQTAVVEIVVDEMTGKEDFGQRMTSEAKLDLARRLLARDGVAGREVIANLGLTLEDVIGG